MAQEMYNPEIFEKAIEAWDKFSMDLAGILKAAGNSYDALLEELEKNGYGLNVDIFGAFKVTEISGVKLVDMKEALESIVKDTTLNLPAEDLIDFMRGEDAAIADIISNFKNFILVRAIAEHAILRLKRVAEEFGLGSDTDDIYEFLVGNLEKALQNKEDMEIIIYLLKTRDGIFTIEDTTLKCEVEHGPDNDLPNEP